MKRSQFKEKIRSMSNNNSSEKKKKKRPRKQETPVKNKAVKKKVNKLAAPDNWRELAPMWIRTPDPLPEALQIQLDKPFLSTVYISKKTDSIRYPYNPDDPNAPHAMMWGLHRAMRYRFFHGQDPDPFRPPSKGVAPKRKASSKNCGDRADRALEASILSGQAPPDAGKKGASPYATAVWNWWKEHHHQPVLAQLPVVYTHTNVATAGDYFTLHTCPITHNKTLWLWELKTGWPQHKDKPDVMGEPLSHVWLTPENKWLLQLTLTRLGYERELGLKISINYARVINVYAEREGTNKTDPVYTYKVRILGPKEANPVDWPLYTDADILYNGLKAPEKKTKKKPKWDGKKKF